MPWGLCKSLAASQGLSFPSIITGNFKDLSGSVHAFIINFHPIPLLRGKKKTRIGRKAEQPVASVNTGKEQLILRDAHLPCKQWLHCDRHQSKRPTFSDRDGYGRKSLGHVGGWAGCPRPRKPHPRENASCAARRDRSQPLRGLWGPHASGEGGGQESPWARARPASPKVCRPDNCGLFAK